MSFIVLLEILLFFYYNQTWTSLRVVFRIILFKNYLKIS